MPLRPGRPEPSDRSIARPRLASRLDRRWECRLTTVVGGPGFGKTSVVVDAIERRRRDHHDVWVSCTPDDSDPDALLSALADALDAAPCAGLADLVDAVWMRTPAQICFVLDDLHEIANDSPGAELCRRLVADLPRNGHVLAISRSAVPIPTARLGTRQQLERITEDDLVFDPDELADFAARRGVDASVLGSCGGWPALAELAAAADDDLVFEYVWDEVLSTIGEERSGHLARLATVGNVDDEIAAAIVPGATARELVDGIPLVERRAEGWVRLHALWSPILRPVIARDVADEVRRSAAAVHLGAGRLDAAIDLYAAAGAWDDVLSVIRSAELDPRRRFDGRAFGRWARMLPEHLRSHPVHRFATALDVAARVPTEAGALLGEVAAAFRADGDVEGEVAALNEHGFELWWANDIAGLVPLIGRVAELAAAGSPSAAVIARIGDAGVAHLTGDSDAVLAALDGIDDRGVWAAGVGWLRHVAYRRQGDTVRAALALDRSSVGVGTTADPQLQLAWLRLDWLEGRIDHVPDGIRSMVDHYRLQDNRYLRFETGLELAAKLAWLGDRREAESIVAEATPQLPDLPGALVRILWLITSAALAVDADDDDAARRLLEESDLAAPDRVDSWYWRDRTATALPYVLDPGRRQAWDASATSAVHRVGIELAAALVAARSGDDDAVRAFRWPAPGVARVHLPARWLAELVDVAGRLGNPAPDALVDLFASPRPGVEIRVLGPLRMLFDGSEVEHRLLQRTRVRELVQLLVRHRGARREVLADLLWPDLPDPRHNLRVTLGYLHTVFEDEMGSAEAQTSYVRADRNMITLVESRVRCDLWELDARLATAERAEQAGDPAAALRAYDLALPLWSGQPFDELAHLDWVRDEQTRWRRRFGSAALRCAELHLAAGDTRGALAAADQALLADPSVEAVYGVAARAHLAAGDLVGARSVLAACVEMLDDHGVMPSESTRSLLVDAGAE